jgi:hypothetical protein
VRARRDSQHRQPGYKAAWATSRVSARLSEYLNVAYTCDLRSHASIRNVTAKPGPATGPDVANDHSDSDARQAADLAAYRLGAPAVRAQRARALAAAGRRL